MLVVADERAVGVGRQVVLPVPDRPKKTAVSPSGPMLAEQCIGMMPCCGSRKLSRPNTDFFISPPYCGAADQDQLLGEVDRDHRFRAAAVALGIGLEARQVDDRVFGREVRPARAFGRTSIVRMNRLCQANSLTTRTLTRCSGCEPPNRSATNSSSLVRARRGSPRAAGRTRPVHRLVRLAPPDVLSVVSSRTMKRSCALRPVWRPVLTTSGPSLAISPSPRRTACFVPAAQ
jgi:hypothetical protein